MISISFGFGPHLVFRAGDQAWIRPMLSPDAEGSYTVTLTDRHGNPVANCAAIKHENPQRIDLPQLPEGYYRLFVSFSGDDTDTAEWAIAIVPGARDPRMAIDVYLSDIRSYPDIEDVISACRAVATMGACMIRDRLHWEVIQPDRGEWNWERHRDNTLAAQAEGLSICTAMESAPAWTHPNDNSRQCPPTDLVAAQEFGAQLATILGPAGVRAIEWWNEANALEMGIAVFAHAYPFQIAGSQKAFFDGVKAVDSGIRILPSSFNGGTNQEWQQRLFFGGLANFCDTQNLHYYGEIDLLSFEQTTVKTYALSQGLSALPRWITESGYDNADGFDSTDWLRRQAEYVMRTFANCLMAGYERVFFFMLGFLQEPDGVQFGMFTGGPYSYMTKIPRPCVYTYAKLASFIEGRPVLAFEHHNETSFTTYFAGGRAITCGTGNDLSRFPGLTLMNCYGEAVPLADATNWDALFLSGIGTIPSTAASVRSSNSSHPIKNRRKTWLGCVDLKRNGVWIGVGTWDIHLHLHAGDVLEVPVSVHCESRVRLLATGNGLVASPSVAEASDGEVVTFRFNVLGSLAAQAGATYFEIAAFPFSEGLGDAVRINVYFPDV